MLKSRMLPAPKSLCVLALLLLSAASLAQAPGASPAPHVASPERGREVVKTVIVGLKARRGVDEGLAQALSEVVQGVYAGDRGRIVLGRQDIAQVLGFESEKQAAGCDDASCLAEVASALDADRLVTGSMDRLGSSYLLVINELDAKRLVPLGRVERQLSVPEEQLIDPVREAARALLGQTTTAATAPLDEAAPGVVYAPPATSSAPPNETEVAAYESALFWNAVGGVTKIASGGACAVLGFPSAALGLFGLTVPTNDANVITPDDLVFGSFFLVTGSACCALGVGLVGWGVFDFLAPPAPPGSEEEAHAPRENDEEPRLAGGGIPMAH